MRYRIRMGTMDSNFYKQIDFHQSVSVGHVLKNSDV